MFYDETPTSPEERRLMKEINGHIGAVQKYRLNNLRATDKKSQYHLLNIEQKLRELVQLEEYLTQRLQELNKPLTLRESELASKILADIPRNYFVLEQKWCRWRNEFTSCLSRGFNLWRSHPQWYLHRLLREDCAMRKGCCSRDCGCCAKRISTTMPERSLGVGHCTVECGCCIRSRGFDLTDSEKAEVKNSESVYAERISCVSILGLVKDNKENPLNLIDKSKDQPPSYNEVTFR
ncbi:hypothetical protein N7528_003647 [Penicillium herquei]|nr:hypothetical protein N7528_003647 [Penicillium herquei]